MPQEKASENTAGGSVAPRLFIMRSRWGRSLEKKVLKWTGYSIANAEMAIILKRPYLPTLLLTTIGRKSGALYETGLSYTAIDGEFIVVGSNAGRPNHPQWSSNIASEPRCWVHVNRRFLPARARILEGAERECALAHCIEQRKILADYERKARSLGREMRLIAVRPNDIEGSSG